MPEPLLSPEQTSDYIGVTTATLEQWRYNGRGPEFIKISARCIRYRPEDVEKWIEDRVAKSTSTVTTAEARNQ